MSTVYPTGHDLAVVHITEDGVKLLEPLEVTRTHVVVNVSHLSLFGLLWRIYNYIKPSIGQVRVFRQLSTCPMQKLSMLLLPRNVSVKAVRYVICKDVPFRSFRLSCTFPAFFWKYLFSIFSLANSSLFRLAVIIGEEIPSRV